MQTRKFGVGLVATAALLGGTVALAGPSGAGERETATLTVTKTVVGTAPADAEFVIHVYCEREPIGPIDTIPIEVVPVAFGPAGVPPTVVYDEEITFGPTGGDENFVFTSAAVCTITEVEDGGATSSTGPVTVNIDEPTLFDAEIVNTFAAAPTTAAPTTAPAPAARAATATPRFTG